jgi:hypothetical protein
MEAVYRMNWKVDTDAGDRLRPDGWRDECVYAPESAAVKRLAAHNSSGTNSTSAIR